MSEEPTVITPELVESQPLDTHDQVVKRRGRPKRGTSFEERFPDNGIETLEERKEIMARDRRTQDAVKRRAKDGIGTLAEAIAQFPGGMKKFLPFVRACSLRDPHLAPLVNAFIGLPRWARNAPRLEEMCYDMGIPPGHLLGVCVEVAYEHHANVTRILTYMSMSKVMKRNITQALKKDGIEDRKMFMQASNILPTPKGSIINVTANAQSATLTKQGDASGAQAFEEGTISLSEVIRSAVDNHTFALPTPIETEVPEEE